ncbi:putative small nuclear ribonucleoprotein G [Capsicum annuum]|uniref:Small nuclear ribonucleoprotein G n=1 Tax=Capsicum annuum TaxID=4072 RepID=A0A2G2YJZ1_CAPAN|nr:putative small nuclear ribonucleoprotein G [Capsicum annuum]
MSRSVNLRISKVHDKQLQIKLNANRLVTGTLCGFDQFMNLVVDNSVEVNGKEKNKIGMVVVGCSTSREVWMALEAIFSSQSRARSMQLRLQLQTTKKGTLSMVDPVSLADLQGLLLSHKYQLEQATVVKPGLGQANLMVKNSNKNNTFFKRNQASNQSYDGKFDHGRGRGSRNNSPNHSQPSSNVSQ